MVILFASIALLVFFAVFLYVRRGLHQGMGVNLTHTIAGCVLGFFLVFMAYYSGLENIPATEEGVVVNAPIVFGDGGVEPIAFKTGRHFVWPTAQLYRYSNMPYMIDEPFDDLPSRDNVQMDFRIHTSVQLVSGASPRVHEKVGPEWYTGRVQKEYRTLIRDEMSSMTGDEMRLDSKKLRAAELSIQTAIEKLLASASIEYSVLNVSIGGVTPPEEVLAESARTAAQTQRKKTETERADAELTRNTAELNRATADKAYMNSMGLTPELFVSLDANNAYRYASDKCASVKDCSMIIGQIGANVALPVKSAK